MRRVLFDEMMPRKLRRDLPDFSIRTAQEEGWGSFKNGELLRRASASFDVLLTADQRMRFQQHVPSFDIGIVVIEVPDMRLLYIRALVPQIREALARVVSGEVILVTSGIAPRDH
ncbi:MAG: hypothetical protein JOZ54_06540 [Acidobacteria bacterium]|nr:hypothetical protein [Acidobacteriota bacterium]